MGSTIFLAKLQTSFEIASGLGIESNETKLSQHHQFPRQLSVDNCIIAGHRERQEHGNNYHVSLGITDTFTVSLFTWLEKWIEGKREND